MLNGLVIGSSAEMLATEEILCTVDPGEMAKPEGQARDSVGRQPEGSRNLDGRSVQRRFSARGGPWGSKSAPPKHVPFESVPSQVFHYHAKMRSSYRAAGNIRRRAAGTRVAGIQEVLGKSSAIEGADRLASPTILRAV